MTNVVILSHERLRLLRQCIESLYANTPMDQFNCVVCDDESQDFRVKKYLRSITHRNFSLLEATNSGHVLSQLKNTAAAYSEQRFGRGEFLHLGDSDVFFMPGWLERMTAMAKTSEMDARFQLWGGQVHPFHEPIKQIAVDMTEHSILDGPSWFMRWNTWDICGPLDRTTAPGPCQSEEYPYCQRIISNGGRIGAISPHVVIHTGLSNSNGQLAPGAEQRRAMIPEGVYAE